MKKFLFGIFIILHGLVHMWYFILSRGIVKYNPGIGWTGKSLILSKFLGDSVIRSLASLLFLVASVLFVIAGIGIIIKTSWWRSGLVVSALISATVIMLYFDGNIQQLVEKGIIGFLIDVAILIAMIV